MNHRLSSLLLYLALSIPAFPTIRVGAISGIIKWTGCRG